MIVLLIFWSATGFFLLLLLFHLRISLLRPCLFYFLLFSKWNINMVLKIRSELQCVFREVSPHLHPFGPFLSVPSLPWRLVVSSVSGWSSLCSFLHRWAGTCISHDFLFILTLCFFISCKVESVTLLSPAWYVNMWMNHSLYNCCPTYGHRDCIQYSQWQDRRDIFLHCLKYIFRVTF